MRRAAQMDDSSTPCNNSTRERMGCVNATLAKRRLNPTYLKLSEEEFIKLNH